MKKYRADATFGEIEQTDIIRETESSVYIASPWAGDRGDRRAKLSETRGYFDTFEEARRFLLESEESKVAALTRELARRQERIEKIREMKA